MMNDLDREKLNALLIELSREAGQRLLNVPGVHAILVTFVGEPGIPLGLTVYDKQHQTANTLLSGITQLTEHINVLARGLMGEGRHERTALDNLGQQGKVQSKSDLCAPPQQDSSATSGNSASS